MHLGHIWTARHIKEELKLDKLYMVVAADPPHKPNAQRLSGQVRYRMLDAALKDEDGIFPSDVELKREGKSFTVDTLSFYKGQYRGAELFLIVGGDMLENFPHWREPERILKLASLAAVGRPDEKRDMRTIADDIEARFGGRVILSDYTGPDISSTEIRRRMYEARPVDTLVTRSTELYMCENAIYMPQELIEIKQKLAKVLKKRRLTHTMLTACEAVKLAARFGADTKKARLAGILHDCAKLPNNELVEFCDRNMYDITDEEREFPYLIHARLGAYFAEEEYGVKDPEILSAIRNHTLGCVGMSLLDKIIYVADKIEPSREYEGLDEMRKAAYEDLNLGMLLVIKHSADYTLKSGREVNPSTKAVIEYLENEIKKQEEHNG